MGVQNHGKHHRIARRLELGDQETGEHDHYSAAVWLLLSGGEDEPRDRRSRAMWINVGHQDDQEVWIMWILLQALQCVWIREQGDPSVYDPGMPDPKDEHHKRLPKLGRRRVDHPGKRRAILQRASGANGSRGTNTEGQQNRVQWRRPKPRIRKGSGRRRGSGKAPS